MFFVVAIWEVLEGREHQHEENWLRQGEHLLNHPKLREKVRFSMYLHGSVDDRRRMLVMGFESEEDLKRYDKALAEDEVFRRLYGQWKTLIDPSTRRVEYWNSSMENLWIKYR